MLLQFAKKIFKCFRIVFLIFLKVFYKISNRGEAKNQILKIKGFKISIESKKKDTIKWWKNKRHQEVDFVLKDHQFMVERNLQTDD